MDDRALSPVVRRGAGHRVCRDRRCATGRLPAEFLSHAHLGQRVLRRPAAQHAARSVHIWSPRASPISGTSPPPSSDPRPCSTATSRAGHSALPPSAAVSALQRAWWDAPAWTPQAEARRRARARVAMSAAATGVPSTRCGSLSSATTAARRDQRLCSRRAAR